MAKEQNKALVTFFERIINASHSLESAKGTLKDQIKKSRALGNKPKGAEEEEEIKRYTKAFETYFRDHYQDFDVSRISIQYIASADEEGLKEIIRNVVKHEAEDYMKNEAMRGFDSWLRRRFPKSPKVWIEKAVQKLTKEFSDQYIPALKRMHKAEQKEEQQAKRETVQEERREEKEQQREEAELKDGVRRDLERYMSEMKRKAESWKKEKESSLKKSVDDIKSKRKNMVKEMVEAAQKKISAEFRKYEDEGFLQNVILAKSSGKEFFSLVYFFDDESEYEKYVKGIKFNGNDKHLVHHESKISPSQRTSNINLSDSKKALDYLNKKGKVYLAIALVEKSLINKIKTTSELSWSKTQLLRSPGNNMMSVEIKEINGNNVSKNTGHVKASDNRFILKAEAKLPAIQESIWAVKITLKHVTHRPGATEEWDSIRHANLFKIEGSKIFFGMPDPEWIKTYIFGSQGYKDNLFGKDGFQTLYLTVYDRRDPKRYTTDEVRIQLEGKVLENPPVPYEKAKHEFTKEMHELNNERNRYMQEYKEREKILKKNFEDDRNFEKALTELNDQIQRDIAVGTKWTSGPMLETIRKWIQSYRKEFEEIKKGKGKYIEYVNKRKGFFTIKNIKKVRALLQRHRQDLGDEFEKQGKSRSLITKGIHEKAQLEREMENLDSYFKSIEDISRIFERNTRALQEALDMLIKYMYRWEQEMKDAQLDPKKEIERKSQIYISEILKGIRKITDVETEFYKSETNLSAQIERLKQMPVFAMILEILANHGITFADFELDEKDWETKIERALAKKGL